MSGAMRSGVVHRSSSTATCAMGRRAILLKNGDVYVTNKINNYLFITTYLQRTFILVSTYVKFIKIHHDFLKL